MPRFSLITPTLMRPSLAMTCQMIDCQSCQSWEHIVIIDGVDADANILKALYHPQRTFLRCPVRHQDGGNTCRQKALDQATGDMVIFVDDDNHLFSPDTLDGIPDFEEMWAIFPIIRLGQRFYSDPPRPCHIDTLNLVLKREVAYWPQTDAYGTDGILVEELKAKFPYTAFPDHPPIGVVPTISFAR